MADDVIASLPAQAAHPVPPNRWGAGQPGGEFVLPPVDDPATLVAIGIGRG